MGVVKTYDPFIRILNVSVKKLLHIFFIKDISSTGIPRILLGITGVELILHVTAPVHDPRFRIIRAGDITAAFVRIFTYGMRFEAFHYPVCIPYHESICMAF